MLIAVIAVLLINQKTGQESASMPGLYRWRSEEEGKIENTESVKSVIIIPYPSKKSTSNFFFDILDLF